LVKLGQLYHWWSFGRDEQKLEMSLRYIQGALSRDPQNIDAHAAMGYILWAKGDFRQSLEFYDKVYELGGDRGWGRAINLTSLGRFDEAVTAYRESLPIYPISLSLKTQLTHAMYCAGRYAEIIEHEDQLIAAWPDDEVGVKYFIAASHARLGNRGDALELVDQLTQALQSETYFASILAAAGEHERARNAIDVLEERDQALESAASAALQFGQTDRALNLLERLDQQLSVGNTGFLLCEPEIRALAGNPRYDAMLDRRGLLPE
jgi:tetratricopeptide (TPR) repeat protein